MDKGPRSISFIPNKYKIPGAATITPTSAITGISRNLGCSDLGISTGGIVAGLLLIIKFMKLLNFLKIRKINNILRRTQRKESN